MDHHLIPLSSQKISSMMSWFLVWFTVIEDPTNLWFVELTNIQRTTKKLDEEHYCFVIFPELGVLYP